MDWYAIGIAGACGAIAAAAGTLIASAIKDKNRSGIVNLIVTGVLFAALYAGANATLIQAHRAQLASEELELLARGNPAFMALEQYAPEVMEEFRVYFRAAIEEGRDPLDIETNLRQIMAGVIGSRLPKASNHALSNSIQLTVDQMRWLRERGDDSCFRFLFPEVNGGIRALEVFSSNLMERDYASTQLILSSYDESQPMPRNEDVVETLNGIYGQLFEKFGRESVAQLADVSAPDIDKAQVCSILIELYASILALPEKESAQTLRWILQ